MSNNFGSLEEIPGSRDLAERLTGTDAGARLLEILNSTSDIDFETMTPEGAERIGTAVMAVASLQQQGRKRR